MTGRKRRPAGSRRRMTDWQPGQIAHLSLLGDGAQQNTPLWSSTTGGDTATLVRIVGQVHVMPQIELAEAIAEGYLYAGVSIVPRVQGAVGVAADPSAIDDREVSWMWLNSWAHRHVVTTNLEALPDWFIPSTNTGGDNPQVDIKVKRKIDLSNDEVVLSFKAISRFGGNFLWSVQVSLRILILEA